MLTLIDAHDAVLDLVPVDLDPVLTPSEVDAALVRTQLAATWTANTAYTFGQRIVPTVPMGRVYLVARAGTSAATEPTWLIAPAYVPGQSPLANWATGFVSDPLSAPASLWGLADGTVAWADAGPFMGELYDVRSAAAECWRMRARKIATGTAGWTEKRVGDLTIKRGATYDQCLRMAASLQPVRVV